VHALYRRAMNKCRVSVIPTPGNTIAVDDGPWHSAWQLEHALNIPLAAAAAAAAAADAAWLPLDDAKHTVHAGAWA
jgi:hypothetical protein